MTVIALSAGDPAGLAAPLREAVRSIDANLPVYNLRTVATLYKSRATDTWLQFFQMVGTMGFIGLALATTGLYGLVAYTVSRRVKEFGIRVALGASRRDVVWLVERRGLILALIGIAIGGALTAIAIPMLAAGFLGLGDIVTGGVRACARGVTDGQRGGKLSAGAKSRRDWIRCGPFGTNDAAGIGGRFNLGWLRRGQRRHRDQRKAQGEEDQHQGKQRFDLGICTAELFPQQDAPKGADQGRALAHGVADRGPDVHRFRACHDEDATAPRIQIPPPAIPVGGP